MLMINRLLLIIFCVCFLSNTKAQLEVVSLSDLEDSFETLENLIVAELFGCDIEISNITYSGNESAIGNFNYTQNESICSAGFELDRGILMTTGLTDYAIGPNNDGDNSQSWNLEYIDDFLHDYLVQSDVISNSVDLYDASVLEFDIESNFLQSIDFEVVFGSEEYVEWMSPYYADGFCFFVSEIGEDIDPNFDINPINIMETADVLNVPSIVNNQFPFGCDIINKPISVWTIRPESEMLSMPGMNECLYIDNQNGEFCNAIGYDGYTIPMWFNFTIVPEAKYHIKMIVFDGGGTSFDSGVFLKRANLELSANIDFTWSEPDYNDVGATVEFSNISSFNFTGNCFWDFDNDGNIDSEEINPIYTFEEPGIHVVTLEVFNDCTGLTTSVSYEIVIDQINLADSVQPMISVFPNPTKDKLNFTLDTSHMNYSVEFIDVSGRVLKNISLVSSIIDVSNFKQGVYYINIKNESGDSMYFDKVIVL